ncbi:MAG: sulfatase-like hydrolase/transferase [Planctomycetes bacterium]|nr:sulfatase-like hydrolase/transferase [Planctomycetota bacterium]
MVMQRRRFLKFIGLGAIAAAAGESLLAAKRGAGKPNIVVIVSDDQGYADVSYNRHHPEEVSTPNIDALAKSGIVLTHGYTTGHVCSPTRAGLMTGRYQQRFGVYTAGAGGSGVPLDEVMFPEYLKKAGYTSGVFGKWHLGLEPPYNPINRGFDEFYGFMGRGAHDYFDLTIANENFGSPIYRDLEPIDDKGYLTNRITEEAVSFIKRSKDKPFFAYVAYNAVHSPAQAPPEDVAKFDTGDEMRDILMAMLGHLDDGVGEIVDALKAAGVYDNTLVFYLSDNGGSGAMHANNAPLRGFKQQDYEGGVHVPFIVSWPGRLKSRGKCSVPVVSFDILPTALAAAGGPMPRKGTFDGKNILPALEGKTDKLHEYICWNSGDGKWAIRQGDWKIVGQKRLVELFNLKNDLGETTDLAAKNPETVQRLTKVYNKWLDEMGEPLGGAFKRWDPKMDERLKQQRQNKADRQKDKKKG